MIKLHKSPATKSIRLHEEASLAAHIAVLAPLVLFGSIASLDILYMALQALWAAELSFWLLPLSCVLALGLILAIWMRIWQPQASSPLSSRLAAMWRSPLAEVITLIFALSWWFRRDTPQAPSSIALLLTLVGLALMIWTGSRRSATDRAH